MLKRGQGLPLETIVIIAAAVIVLVIVLLFATGAFSRLFGGERILESEATPEKIASFRLGCENACFQAKQLAHNSDDWRNSNYCTKRLIVNNTPLYDCWTANVSCSKDIANSTGGIWHCNATGTECSCQ